MTQSASIIRRATTADAAGILACLRAAFAPYERAYTPEAFRDTVLTPESIHQRLAEMAVFVAVTDDGSIIGTVGCAVQSPSCHPERASAKDLAVALQSPDDPVPQSLIPDPESLKEGHIRGMAVLPSWQGLRVRVSRNTELPVLPEERSDEAPVFAEPQASPELAEGVVEGTAAELLHAAERYLRSQRCTRVTLDTTAPLQRAIRFYERNGYRASGRVIDFFGMPLYEYVKDLP
jgi:GNAT superfamily N-acetyltransferase